MKPYYHAYVIGFDPEILQANVVDDYKISSPQRNNYILKTHLVNECCQSCVILPVIDILLM